MKESTKGVLLSALIYPGAGQLAQGSKFVGAVFIILTTAGLFLIIYRITKRIVHSVNQLLSMAPDGSTGISSFIDLISRAPYDSWRIEVVGLIVVFSCWAGSILHAYLSGKKSDKSF